ncbi:OpgC domain-containing protein [Motilimonas pumila]|uniref:DUF1624 domain-containing protein n=1 Tax=Motilimonas pumila TaxID=2303987 RepID=A0A418YKG1_9GAMM|nr:OpgC domain-containing protein [Motilimonas pumila]RJG51472.1 DUF1624 domain-containing protein [Motilimonas pumila]
MVRINSLDGLRGGLLLIMTINHLVWSSGGQSALQLLTLQPLGQVGAAEAFILLSGILAGLVYSSDKLSASELKQKAWRRAGLIYLYHIAAWLLVVLVASVICELFPTSKSLYQVQLADVWRQPIASFIVVASLLARPAFFDILPLYILMMLTLPWLIRACQRGKIILLLVLSMSLWFASNWIQSEWLSQALLTYHLPFQPGYFDPWAWQFLFVIGVIIGVLRRQGKLHIFHSRVALGVAVGLCGVVFLAHHHFLLDLGWHQGRLYALADKPELGTLRLINLLLLAYILACLLRYFPKLLAIPGLSLVGRHSLQVFAWHLVLITLAAPLLNTLLGTDWYTPVLLICAATLLPVAYLHQKWQQRSQSQPLSQPSHPDKEIAQ